MGVVAIIPARLDSYRLPGKLLLPVGECTLIQQTYKNIQSMGLFDDIYVATDSTEIASNVTDIDAKVVMTQQHPNGTSRIAEAVKQLQLDNGQIVVNVQGDEPLLERNFLTQVTVPLKTARTDVATLVYRDTTRIYQSNHVKCIVTRKGFATWFTRFAIPYAAIHIGLYAYTVDALKAYARSEPSTLEQHERLEQLRFIEIGKSIFATYVHRPIFSGIDTKEQYESFKQWME